MNNESTQPLSLRLSKLLAANGKAFVAIIITLYSCRLLFYEECDMGIDGSWTWALNYAINKGSIFGSDFVFTYGPLGFLSTRYLEYINPLKMLAGDLLIFGGMYHLIYKVLSPDKRWWLPFFAGAVCFRHANYSQAIFILFIIYLSHIALSKKSDNYSAFFCGVYGVMLFFVKINYGIPAIFLIALTIVLMAIRDIRKATIMASVSTLTFTIIYMSVNISIAKYVKYGYHLIIKYDEAMCRDIQSDCLPYLSALLVLAITVMLLAVYIHNIIKHREADVRKIYAVCIILFAGFMLYKNGFTRYDQLHYGQFFASYTFMFICVLYLTGQRGKVGLVAGFSVVSLCLTNIVLALPDKNQSVFDNLKNMFSPATYYIQLFDAMSGNPRAHESAYYEREPDVPGWPSADLLPDLVSRIRVNKFNYDARPVPQSYSVYSHTLDTLNARHFIKTDRPEIVLVSNQSIDRRYAMWDESVTKAAIHLNYEYRTEMHEGKPGMPRTNTYLLMGAKKGAGQEPQFALLSKQQISMGQAAPCIQDTTYPVYMTVRIRYTPLGFIQKILYQPQKVYLTLIDNNGKPLTSKLILPIAEGPVLISKMITSIYDLKNFMTGNIASIKNVKAFIISTENEGIRKDMEVSFYHFTNY